MFLLYLLVSLHFFVVSLPFRCVAARRKDDDCQRLTTPPLPPHTTVPQSDPKRHLLFSPQTTPNQKKSQLRFPTTSSPHLPPRPPSPPLSPNARQTHDVEILCHAPLHAVGVLDRERLWLRGLPPCRPSSPLPITFSSSHVARLTVTLLSAQSRASSIATCRRLTHVGRALRPTSLSRLLSYVTTPRATVDGNC